MKKKVSFSKVLFVLLLLTGLGVLLYPTASDWYTRWQISKELNSYSKLIEADQADYSALWDAAEAYNRSLLEKDVQFLVDREEQAYVGTLLNPLGTGMMGHIEIPEIHVDLPIYQGTEEQQLQSGAGYWIGSSLPTGGASTHCVITAHTGLIKAKLFTDLDQLEVGDIFYLHVLDRDMAYEVDQIQIAEPEDLSALNIVEGEDYVTLYTCYPYGVNTQRLLVRGCRIELAPEETFGSVTETRNGLPWWGYAFICLTLLAFLGIVLWKKHRKRYSPKYLRRKIRETSAKGEENNV